MRNQKGWTLMELLIVIAIVVVLASLVYAIGAYALEQSRQGQCISNLRQIGIALKLYMEDYKQADWDTEIDSYQGIANQREREALVARWGFPDDLWALYRCGYVKTVDLFKCRSVRHQTLRISPQVHYAYSDPSVLINIPGFIEGRPNTIHDHLWRLKQEKHNYKIVRDLNHNKIVISLHLDGRVERRPPCYIPVSPSGYLED